MGHESSHLISQTSSTGYVDMMMLGLIPVSQNNSLVGARGTLREVTRKDRNDSSPNFTCVLTERNTSLVGASLPAEGSTIPPP